MTIHRTAVLLAALLLSSTSDRLWAQAQGTPTASKTRTELLKTIVFITVDVTEPDQPAVSGTPARPGTRAKAGVPAKPGKDIRMSGTGFLVDMPDSRAKNNQVFRYLVTNRHVAEAIEQDEKGNCVPLKIKSMYVEMNLKDPINGNRLRQIPIPLSHEVHWYFPKDSAIDLAVIPYSLADPDKYDFQAISSEQFLSTDCLDKRHIVPGDKVLTGGVLLRLCRAARDSAHFERRYPSNVA